MKDANGRWQHRFRVMGAVLRRPHAASLAESPASGPATVPLSAAPAIHAPPRPTAQDLRVKISHAALAFRGYDIANLGRSRELLDHPAYGAVVSGLLLEASAVASETLHRPIHLESYIRAGESTSLEHFPEDVAMIVAMELAQVRLLETFFDVPVRDARLTFGYSIGELAALVMGGTFRLDQLLPIPLNMAADCAELAADTKMGILFTRAPELPEDAVERLCLAVSSEGKGMIAPSAWLSPNTALVLGQGDTLDRLEKRLREFLPEKVLLRRNPNKWPPLHTPLVWQRSITNRAAVELYHIEGGGQPPKPPVLCGSTGEASYNGLNNRELLIQWIDRPQRLWDCIDATLSAGVELVIHAGPTPNLIPATFARLSNNVSKQLGNGYRHKMGKGLVSRMNRHTWLAHLLPHKAALLRAPFLEHVILEDWLLEQKIA
jgi:[acyl-carrier-protein] S-malonyltransferase